MQPQGIPQPVAGRRSGSEQGSAAGSAGGRLGRPNLRNKLYKFTLLPQQDPHTLGGVLSSERSELSAAAVQILGELSPDKEQQPREHARSCCL